ncbi:MAG: HAD hydrolase-like protein [Ktedonobacteraceae bacterium]|nr:HAD hydrolase-like protein [Ktedonobacteraceae bacterium]
MVKAIIFDWGRTLYDSENQMLFPGTEVILQILSKLYLLVIVSLASDGNIEKRLQIIRECGIEKYFTAVYFAQNDKDSLYTMALLRLALTPREVAIVDDRVVRGIRWGNANGATTIWLKQGKFMSEESDRKTGPPTYIVSRLEEICSLQL